MSSSLLVMPQRHAECIGKSANTAEIVWLKWRTNLVCCGNFSRWQIRREILRFHCSVSSSKWSCFYEVQWIGGVIATRFIHLANVRWDHFAYINGEKAYHSCQQRSLSCNYCSSNRQLGNQRVRVLNLLDYNTSSCDSYVRCHCPWFRSMYLVSTKIKYHRRNKH